MKLPIINFRVLGTSTLLAVFTLFLAVQTATAQDDIAQKVIGTWKFDIDKSVDVPEEVRKEMANVSIVIIFSDETVSVIMDGIKAEESPYEISAIENEDNKYKLTLDGEGGELTVLGDDEIKVAPRGQKPMVFVRQPNDAVEGSETKETEDAIVSDAMSMDDIRKFAVGGWKIDEDATRKFIENEGRDLDRIPNISIKMNKDGTAKVGEGSNELTDATYLIRETEEGAMELVTTVDDDERVFEFRRIDNDHIAMRPNSSLPMFIFKRQKP